MGAMVWASDATVAEAGTCPGRSCRVFRDLGDGILSDQGDGCSMGLFGTLGSNRYMVTAGHCYHENAGAGMFFEMGRYESGIPDDLDNYRFGYALARMNDDIGTSSSVIDGNVVANPFGIKINGLNVDPQPGQRVCKQGWKTRNTCGTIREVHENYILADDLKSTNGDSGGVVYLPAGGTGATIGILIGKYRDTDTAIIQPIANLLDVIEKDRGEPLLPDFS
ncbi:chymotrypsin family serine protease [Nocardia tengchongensis]|uniref:hypothetical protein n=1 Tax=Nocardia tengchongensis TaxID=2055889 RepID=UPI00365AD761